MISLRKSLGHLVPVGLVVLVLLACVSLDGNDSAASTAAGGIRLRREARISMEKERLTIGGEKVTVEYEFWNQSSQDITTEVAFPVPPYGFEFDDPGAPRGFDDFRVWVDGEEVKYHTETRATLKGRDYTNFLRKLDVDILSFASFDFEDPGAGKYQVAKLPKQDQEELLRIGLIDRRTRFPAWIIRKTYHWTQKFPARKVLRVRHEYKPVIGFSQIPVDYVDPAMRVMRGEISPRSMKGVLSTDVLRGIVHEFRQACVDAKTADRLRSRRGDFVFASWVEYILTTANSWQMPIKDFELIVDTKNPWDDDPIYVNFCWDAPVERIDAFHLSAHKKDFVPTRELFVYFIRVPRNSTP